MRDDGVRNSLGNFVNHTIIVIERYIQAFCYSTLLNAPSYRFLENITWNVTLLERFLSTRRRPLRTKRIISQYGTT